jgi:hypothetical protein
LGDPFDLRSDFLLLDFLLQYFSLLDFFLAANDGGPLFRHNVGSSKKSSLNLRHDNLWTVWVAAADI